MDMFDEMGKGLDLLNDAEAAVRATPGDNGSYWNIVGRLGHALKGETPRKYITFDL